MSGSIGTRIQKPKQSVELAEFVGILIGDGGIGTYQVKITLHAIDDRDYCLFVVKQIQKLFGFTPAIQRRKHALAVDIVMSRIELVRYLCATGMPIGNKIKAGIDIPTWISDRDDYMRACVRGLVDTDGSVFTHTYKSKGKHYSYKKLSFTSSSAPLLHSVQEFMRKENMNARIGSNNDVRLDSKIDMETYFSRIGSHNEKHLRRYRS